MVASVLIILFSLALLVYWVRYTCLLLVKEAKPLAGASYAVFAFPRIRTQLQAGTSHAKLQEALARDYAVLAYLMSKAPVRIEAKLLVWDYRLVRCWYALSSIVFPAQASRTVQEMADVVATLAYQLKSADAAAR